MPLNVCFDSDRGRLWMRTVGTSRRGRGRILMGALLLVMASFLTVMPGGAMAEDEVQEETSDEIRNQIEEARFAKQVERKTVVERNMKLTPEEAEKFWPLYDEYTARIFTLNDGLAQLLAEYVAAYVNNSLSDEQARHMLKDYLQYEETYARLRSRYAKKFSRVLPARKVMRFFQIENKLEAIAGMELAREVPLVQ